MFRNVFTLLVCLLSLSLAIFAQGRGGGQGNPPAQGNPNAGAVTAIKVTPEQRALCSFSYTYTDPFTSDTWVYKTFNVVLNHPTLNNNPDAVITLTHVLANSTPSGGKLIFSSPHGPGLQTAYMANPPSDVKLLVSPDYVNDNCPAGRWLLLYFGGSEYYKNGQFFSSNNGPLTNQTFYLNVATPGN